MGYKSREIELFLCSHLSQHKVAPQSSSAATAATSLGIPGPVVVRKCVRFLAGIGCMQSVWGLHWYLG